jgi:uncharacterized protein YybS (DUF2232 family)
LLPWLLRREVPWDRAVIATLVLMLVLGTAALVGVTSGSVGSALQLVDSQIDREIEQTVALMQTFAGEERSAAETESFRQLAVDMGEFMHRAYPGMLVAVCAALQLVTVGLLALLVRPANLPGAAFSRWRSPELLIWPLIAAGFAVAFAAGAVQTVALNVLIVILPVYFLQGLAVVEHFLSRKGLSPLLRALSFLLLLLVNPLPVVVTGVGVFDLWADFRKPRLSKE